VVTLDGQIIAFLVAKEGVEQVELTTPWEAVRDAGATPRLISPEKGKAQAFRHLDRADTFPVDQTADEADPSSFDALVLPGGVANGDLLRWQVPARDFVRRFVATGRLVAVICHGGWVLIDTDVVRDRRITSWPSLATDYRNAGAQWTDEELVVDLSGPVPLISSRKPADLPAFSAALVEQLDRHPAGTRR
jgi:protease I